MILDFDGATPYVVADGSTAPDHERHGCPKPPYFIFRWTTGAWQRIDYEQLPQSIRKSNLMPSATRGGKPREGVGRGRATVEDVKQSQQWLSRYSKEVREDAPNPCATRRDDFKYVPLKRP